MNKFFIFCFWLFFISFSAGALTTFDPLTISVGARSLGMGKAGVALADGGDAIFHNPAALSEIKDFQFTSMSGKILDEVHYLALGGVFPLRYKTAIGFAFVNDSIYGIDILDKNGVYQKSSNFSNRVFLASFGAKCFEKISFGLGAKYYLSEGSEVKESNGNGISLDFGILQSSPTDWLALGVVGQNILGLEKIQYQNGETENLPSILKIGSRLYLLGEDFNALLTAKIELSLLVDAEISLKTQRPLVLHTGAELALTPNLILRAGLDQDPQPSGVVNNLTAGLTLKLSGISFHYAYHPYGDLAENASHYFSLSFDGTPPPNEGPRDIFLAFK